MPIMVLAVVIAGVYFVLKRKMESKGQDSSLSVSSDLLQSLCEHSQNLFQSLCEHSQNLCQSLCEHSQNFFQALCAHARTLFTHAQKLFKADRGASSNIRNIEHIILKKDETIIDKITVLTMDTNLLVEEFRMLENVVVENIDEKKREAMEDENLSHNRYKDIGISYFIKLCIEFSV